MPSSYSPKLRFELIGAGEQAGLWGTTTNKNLGELVEQAVAGVTNLELDGLSGDYVLTALDGTIDQARSAVVQCTYSVVPAVGALNIIIPTQTKLYLARNSCGQTVTFKTVAQTNGVEIPNGEATLVFCDGQYAYAGIQTPTVGTLTVSGGGTGVTSFVAGVVKSLGGTAALGTGAVDLESEVTGTLPVTNGGTGATSWTSGALLLGNGTSAFTELTAGTSGYIVRWNGTAWAAAAPPSAPVTSFNSRTGAVTPDSGDYSSYYPSTGGSGASGTWGISITGSASSASSATSAGSISNSSSNGYGSRTISSSNPSGGSNGDVWYKV
jgi:hypothetical protein